MISPSYYHRILQNKITDTYKLDDMDSVSKINNNTAKFANKVHINDRIGILVKKIAYILVKKP